MPSPWRRFLTVGFMLDCKAVFSKVQNFYEFHKTCQLSGVEVAGSWVLLGGVRLLSLARSLLRQCPGAFRVGAALAAACGAGAEFRGIAGRTEGNMSPCGIMGVEQHG